MTTPGERRKDNLPRGVGCVQRWQVFGLASVALRRLLSTLPDAIVSACVEVVLAYRCGAVPASHRIPFSADAFASAPAWMCGWLTGR
jgi:hypothetical protein